MSSWRNIFIVVSLSLIIIEMIMGFDVLGIGVMVGIAIAFILTGFPHGAMDLWISHRAGYWRSWPSFVVFHLIYVACAALCFMVFSVWESLALLAFLAFSIVHFADDWDDSLPQAVRLLLSFSAITLPFIAHPIEVANIFGVMLGEGSSATQAELGSLNQYLPMVLVGSLGAVAVIDWRQLPLPATVFAGAFFLPPLIYFGLYFALWHSPLHLHRHADLITSKSKRTVLVAYALVAAVMAGTVTTLAMPAISSLSIADHIIRMIFWGLAALTVPHMILLARTGAPIKHI